MKRQKECFIGVSAVVHLFLKIAGAMPVVFLLFLVVNVLHGTAWALETLARQVFFDGLQSAVERNSLQAAYSGALWVGAAARAIATRCHCPPDRSSESLTIFPSFVSIPCFKSDTISPNSIISTTS